MNSQPRVKLECETWDANRQTDFDREIETELDLETVFQQLRHKYSQPICLAATGIISKKEAKLRIRRMSNPKIDVLIEEANEDAKRLLKDYRHVLPEDLK